MEKNMNDIKPGSQLLIYQNPDGSIKIDVLLEEETVWLTQAHMAELFGKGRTTITEHIRNILKKVNWTKNWYVGISDIPHSMGRLKEKHRPRL